MIIESIPYFSSCSLAFSFDTGTFISVDMVFFKNATVFSFNTEFTALFCRKVTFSEYSEFTGLLFSEIPNFLHNSL